MRFAPHIETYPCMHALPPTVCSMEASQATGWYWASCHPLVLAQGCTHLCCSWGHTLPKSPPLRFNSTRSTSPPRSSIILLDPAAFLTPNSWQRLCHPSTQPTRGKPRMPIRTSVSGNINAVHFQYAPSLLPYQHCPHACIVMQARQGTVVLLSAHSWEGSGGCIPVGIGNCHRRVASLFYCTSCQEVG